MSTDTDYYNAVGAWFLGPRGENAEDLLNLFSLALKAQVAARNSFHPDDESPYTQAMINSNEYKENLQKLTKLVTGTATQLAKTSVPFFSPRYNAHMNMDTSMPGIIGYLTTMMFNPNNVAVEASPLTTAMEIQVGRDLAKMIGFNVTDASHGGTSKKISEQDPGGDVLGWGHITADGSIANLESCWAARNLKFYPLSLWNAMQKELKFISDRFAVETASGEKKLFKDFSTWELLNINPPIVLSLPTRLTQEFEITPTYLANIMNNYLIQTVGKDALEKQFKIEQPGAYFASATKHYSWPKAAAVTGIGSENVIGIQVDDRARLRIDDLRAKLQECLDKKRFVYSVVAIIGSTEHGAIDPLHEIVELREEFRFKGLTFVLHADGAWGTYFASMISPELRRKTLEDLFPTPKGPKRVPNRPEPDPFVPIVPLSKHSVRAVVCLQFCDSVTVDPHKSGYVQYPAGGLLYRDGRMRYLVTWTSPIVYRGEAESIGVYGIEGSKPGAAPAAVWFSNDIIGLHPKGYGQLLGQAVFSSIKMYANLVTMSQDDSPFIVTVLNKLPAEEANEPDPAKKKKLIEDQKEFIRKRILPVPNRQLFDDKDAWDLVTEMGSDLCINAFAVNFKLNGVPNTDIVEANYLNKRIFQKLSITSLNADVDSKPLILTSTVFSQNAYTTCLDSFKDRLQLKGPQDLYTLVNVVMSPFPTIDDLTAKICKSLKQVITEEMRYSVYRNTLTDDGHGFLMQGLETVYLVHFAMFFMENHRMQLIITGDMDPALRNTYRGLREEYPNELLVLGTAVNTTLEKILAHKEFDAALFKGIPGPDDKPLATGKLTNIKVVLQKDLHTASLTPYPASTMPFALYSCGQSYHIDHIYTAAPNIQLTAANVLVDAGNKTLPNFAYAHLPYPEVALQPFSTETTSGDTFFFRPNQLFKDVKFTTGESPDSQLIGTGTLQLGDNVFIDTHMLNEDPEPPAKPETKPARDGFYMQHAQPSSVKAHHAANAPTKSTWFDVAEGLRVNKPL